MRANRPDSGLEKALRSALHARGLRFRKHHQPIAGLHCRPDVVFTRARLVVFVDGCFWHGCPEHATWPAANADYWRDKIETNRLRDRDTDARLEAEGWAVVRVWEHEPPVEAADRIEQLVRSRRP